MTAPQWPKLMDDEQLKDWILRRLGAPMVRVDLTSDHLDDCVERAKRWFSAKKGTKKRMVMPVTSGQTEYDLPDEVDTIIDLSFSLSPFDVSLIFSPHMLVDEKVPYDVFAAPRSGGLYSSFVQALQYNETAKRILGAEPEWRQDGRILYLFPVPKVDGGVVIDFKAHLVTIEQLSERDHDLIKRYALACAKQDVSMVRSKYGNQFPSAQGQASLDGDKLETQAKDEFEKLEEEIFLSAGPAGFLTG